MTYDGRRVKPAAVSIHGVPKMKRKPKSVAEAITRAVDDYHTDNPNVTVGEILKALTTVFKLLWSTLPKKLPRKGDGEGGWVISARVPDVKIKRIAA